MQQYSLVEIFIIIRIPEERKHPGQRIRPNRNFVNTSSYLSEIFRYISYGNIENTH